MSTEESLKYYTWVKLDFLDDLKISTNASAKTVITDNFGNYLIWEQEAEVLPPQGSKGRLISILINQMKNPKKIGWVSNEDEIYLYDGKTCSIYDIYELKLLVTIELNDFLSIRKLKTENYLIAYSNGLIDTYDRGKLKKLHKKIPPILWVRENQIVCYPQYYSIQGFNIERQTLSITKYQKSIKRDFEKANNFRIDAEFISLVENLEEEYLKLSDRYLYLFEDVNTVILDQFPGLDCLIFISEKFILFRSLTTEIIDIIINQEPLVLFGSNTKVSFGVIKNRFEERRIIFDNKMDKFVIERLNDILYQSDIIFQNLPNSFFVNLKPKVELFRANFENQFVWIPDFNNDHVFLDLLTSKSILFDSTSYDRQIYILVEENGEFVLEWVRGNKFPEGKLTFYGYQDLKSFKIILYNWIEDNISDKIYYELKRKKYEIEAEGQIQINESFPLIIPEWHQINLWILYQEPLYSTALSLSSYYFLLQQWSKQDNLDLIKFKKISSRPDNYCYFGDLNIEYEDQTYIFEGICPIFDYNAESGLLLTYNFEKKCFLWDLKKDPYIPMLNLETEIPLFLKILPKDELFIIMNFQITENKIYEIPKPDYTDSFIKSPFPKLKIIIVDYLRNKKYTKFIKFPTHIIDNKFQVASSNTNLIFTLPHYIDLESDLIIYFNKHLRKFQIKNNSKFKRYWQTHSYSSPESQIGEGLEYIREEYPEIKREIALRPNNIVEKHLVRKSDRFVLMGIESEEEKIINQKSSDQRFQLKNSTSLKVPFYNDRLKEIFITGDESNYINNKNLKILEGSEEIPLFYQTELNYKNEDIALKKRINDFLNGIYTHNIKHCQNGISYASKEIDEYKLKIKAKIEELESSSPI